MAQPNPDKPIAQRVCDFFERQLGWYGLVLDDLAGVESRLEGPDEWPSWDIAEQEAQLRALLTEWRKGPQPAADVERVRTLAGRAEQKAAQVAEALQGASQRAGARAEEVRRDLEGLQKTRRVFGAYRQAETNEPGFIDEQA